MIQSKTIKWLKAAKLYTWSWNQETFYMINDLKDDFTVTCSEGREEREEKLNIKSSNSDLCWSWLFSLRHRKVKFNSQKCFCHELVVLSPRTRKRFNVSLSEVFVSTSCHKRFKFTELSSLWADCSHNLRVLFIHYRAVPYLMSLTLVIRLFLHPKILLCS